MSEQDRCIYLYIILYLIKIFDFKGNASHDFRVGMAMIRMHDYPNPNLNIEYAIQIRSKYYRD